MGRIMAIDYGEKRIGLAVTDVLKMIANPLGTVSSADALDYLKNYFSKNEVECVLIGDPKRLNDKPSSCAAKAHAFAEKIKKTFPAVKVVRVDERYTSKMASQALIDSGAKKKTRQRKELLDTLSATIILQNYLESLDFQNNQNV